MAKGKFLFTSESVSEGHPDKLADQISDGVLDALFAQDPFSRVACETMVTTGVAIIAGEITTKAIVDYTDIVRHAINDVGYNDDRMGICGDTCAVIQSLDRQSPDIAQGVNEDQSKGKEIGAGDQGLMFGYACNDTPELMPLPIALSHRILARLTALRKANKVAWIRPDSKSQVTVEYEGRRPVRIDTVVVSTQHADTVSHKEIREFVIEEVIKPVLPEELLTGDPRTMSTPRAGSWWAARTATAGSPGGRSSSTPTAAGPGTAAGPSAARTPPKWTAARPTWPGTWPRTSWPPAWLTPARCSWPMPSA